MRSPSCHCRRCSLFRSLCLCVYVRVLWPFGWTMYNSVFIRSLSITLYHPLSLAITKRLCVFILARGQRPRGICVCDQSINRKKADQRPPPSTEAKLSLPSPILLVKFSTALGNAKSTVSYTQSFICFIISGSLSLSSPSSISSSTPSSSHRFGLVKGREGEGTHRMCIRPLSPLPFPHYTSLPKCCVSILH